MTALLPGSALFDQVFDGVTLPSYFKTTGLNRDSIQNGFLDGSNSELFSTPEVTNAVQATDMRDAMRLAVKQLSVVSVGDPTIPLPNFPSTLLPGLRTILASAEIPSTLSDAGVEAIFTAAVSGDIKAVAGAVIGLGMGAITIALPVVGAVAGAIIGLTKGIIAIVKGQKEKLKKEKEEDRAKLYRSFPPLQEADAPLDGAVVDLLVLPTLRKRDWTRIWLPRFDGEEWVGLERQGGFGFAPGKKAKGSDELGAPDAFEPSKKGGLGVLPGTNQVSAVMQVSLVHDPDADGNEAWVSFTKGGKDPRGIDKFGVKGWTRVQDTGLYYPSTGRLAASMWSLALAKGSPYKYRLDALAMHEAWRTWAEGGIRYIRETCYPWWNKYMDGNGRLDQDALDAGEINLEGFFGTAIFQAVGAWACNVSGGKYNLFNPPYGATGPQLSALTDAYGEVDTSMSSLYSGGFLPIRDASRWPDKCMGNVYSRGINIKGTLDQLQAAQRYELRHTLICASVSRLDAAFVGDPDLAELLTVMRAKLLQSEDRFYVDMADVPEGEQGPFGVSAQTDWRKQLLASGVPLTPPAARPKQLRIAPTNEKPPPPAPFFPANPNPFEPGHRPKRVGRKSSGGGLGLMAALTGTALVGGGLAAAFATRQRGRRNFSAGRAS